MTEGTLFVVATPIGNLDDISPRARDVLRAVDTIAAEDTRVTGRLLSHFGINGRQTALHEHNESRQVPRLIRSLQEGRSVALVSDAGTPLVSDPGYRLVRAARDAGIRVSPVPGASAVLAALSVCGLSTDRFVFEGFLPTRKSARNERLRALANETRSVVLFESVHRVVAMLQELSRSFGGNRRAFLGRELTKMHEQCISADLDALAAMSADGRIPLKGEFVVVTEGAAEAPLADSHIDIDRLLTDLTAVLPARQTAGIVAAATGQSRNELYRRVVALKAAASGDKSGDNS